MAFLATATPTARDVFDLPHVAAIAAAKITQAGLTDRIETAGGSLFEQLPGNHDVHLLIDDHARLGRGEDGGRG